MSCCVECGIIDASPIAGAKPRAKEQARERVLSYDELGALWATCDAEGYLTEKPRTPWQWVKGSAAKKEARRALQPKKAS
jgi:hypothetical protein